VGVRLIHEVAERFVDQGEEGVGEVITVGRDGEVSLPLAHRSGGRGWC
jgi:hypothetical protein